MTESLPASTPWLASRAGPLVVSLLIFGALLAPVLSGDLKPDVGLETRNRGDTWVIESVTPGGLAHQAGLRSGDIVLELDGSAPAIRRVTSPSLDIRDVRAWAIARGGEQLEFVIDPTAAPLATRLEPLVMLALAIVFWASALFVELTNPLDALGRRYWRLSMATALAVGLAPAAALDNVWAKPLEVLAFAVAPAFFYDFCTAFAPASLTRRRCAELLAGVGVAVGLGYLVAGYLGAGWYDAARAILLILLSVGCLCGIAALVRAYRRPPSALARHQIQIVAVGAAAGVLPVTLLSAIPDALGQALLVRPQLVAFTLIALPLAVAYAIVRHKLLDIDLVLSRTLVYTAMALLLAGAYALLLETPNLLALGRLNTMPPPLAVGFFAVVTLSFIPVHSRLRRLIDRLVYRDRYDHVYFLRELAAHLASVAPIDEVLPRVTLSIAQAMNLEGAAVLLRQADGTLAVRATTGAYDPESGHCVPLVARGKDAGLLYLGPKRTRAPLGPEDLSVAQTIASSAAITVANTLLVERLRTKVTELELMREQLLHVEETERKRLAQDLHDGALHTVLAFVRAAESLQEKLVDVPPVSSQLGALADRGRDAAYELRATCSDLYPSELEHLGLVAALESLAEAKSVPEDLEVVFTRRSFPIDFRLPEVVEDTLYRAAREALDNITRHAHATRVSIDLKLEPTTVLLTIVDNGQGLGGPISSVVLLRSGHFGLASMRERAERLGGSVDIGSRRGSGIRLRVRVPREADSTLVEALSA
jgi:signal transduction histidine kinase